MNDRLIAIAGASGFVGQHLAAWLVEQGYRVHVLLHSPRASLPPVFSNPAVQVFQGDLERPESLQGFLAPGCLVVNLVYLWTGGELLNRECMHNLMAACDKAGVRRIVHVSTAAVSGRVDDDVISEDTPCRPVTEYGATKLAVEQDFIAYAGRSPVDVAIVRPTAVFGPGGAPLKKLAEDLTAGPRWKNYLKSSLFGRRKMNLVPVRSVAAAIGFLLEREADCKGEIYIVSSDDAPENNFRDVERALIGTLGVVPYALPAFPIPLGVLSMLLRSFGRNNINPTCGFSPGRLIDMGFVYPVDFNSAIAEYGKWYRHSAFPDVTKVT